MNFWISYTVKIAPANEVKKKKEVELEIIHITKYHCHFGSSVECETLTEALSVCTLDGQIEVQLGVVIIGTNLKIGPIKVSSCIYVMHETSRNMMV